MPRRARPAVLRQRRGRTRVRGPVVDRRHHEFVTDDRCSSWSTWTLVSLPDALLDGAPASAAAGAWPPGGATRQRHYPAASRSVGLQGWPDRHVLHGRASFLAGESLMVDARQSRSGSALRRERVTGQGGRTSGPHSQTVLVARTRRSDRLCWARSSSGCRGTVSPPTGGTGAGALWGRSSTRQEP
jgi:hypothetical protein